MKTTHRIGALAIAVGVGAAANAIPAAAQLFGGVLGTFGQPRTIMGGVLTGGGTDLGKSDGFAQPGGAGYSTVPGSIPPGALAAACFPTPTLVPLRAVVKAP